MNITEVERNAAWIAQLNNDWDGEGSPGYTEAVLDRAFVILRAMNDAADGPLPPPIVSPAESGSIDLYWRGDSPAVLINVPPSDDVVFVCRSDDVVTSDFLDLPRDISRLVACVASTVGAT